MEFTATYINNLGNRRLPYEDIITKYNIPINGTIKNYNIIKMKELIINHFNNDSTMSSQPESNIHNTTQISVINQEDLPVYNIQEMVISREGLKAKIHDIHNFLRNNGAGYGMNALKIFNLLYGLKMIESNNLFEITGLSDVCRFSNLLEMVNQARADPQNRKTLLDKLALLIMNDILDELYVSKIKGFLYYHLNSNLSGLIFAYVINKIEEIYHINNEQLSGKIYEYFIGRDKSAISELGAYFTNRSIINFIYDEVQPELINGEVPTMIDMFGGSGGFTLGYINYMNRFNPDWDINAKNVSHYDMNEDVVKYQALETFCMTGKLPNMDTLKGINSFTYTFPQKYHYIFTNPPYGGDNISVSEEEQKLTRMKDYLDTVIKNKPDNIKQHQLNLITKEIKKMKKIRGAAKVSVENRTCGHIIKLYAKKHKLIGKDKEACSLILMMALLEEGGTAVGVLKNGVFFAEKYSGLRRHLLENFNVLQVIEVPSDQFENTSVSTCILIFTTGKTETVCFSEFKIDFWDEEWSENEQGFINMVHSATDIKDVYKKMISVASLDEILSKKTLKKNKKTGKFDIYNYYKLVGKEYSMFEIIPGDGYTMKKIKDICIIQPKSNRPANFGEPEGQYNFYCSSDKIKKCNVADYNEKSIIIGTGGKSSIFIDTNFSSSSHTVVFTSNYLYIIYCILKYVPELIERGLYGSTGLRNISINYLLQLEIPMPNNDRLIYWNELIESKMLLIEESKSQIEILEQEIFMIFDNINDNDIKYKFSDVLERGGTGKSQSKKITNTGEYLYYGPKANNPSGTHDTYDFDDELYLLFCSGGSVSTPSKSLGLGKTWVVSGKIATTCDMVKFNVLNNHNIYAIAYYLQYKLFDIQLMGKSSTGLGHIDMHKLSNTDIYICEISNQINKIHSLRDIIKITEHELEDMFIDLKNEAIKNIKID